jgi:hypothetical protein
MPHVRKSRLCTLILLGIVILSGHVCYAESWNWKEQTVDGDPGTFTSIAMDKDGNLHLLYSSDAGAFRWAFRPFGDTRWYKMDIRSGVGFTGLALDGRGNPHVCLTKKNVGGILEYGSFENAKWHFQEIDPGSGAIWYSCSVGISTAGIPHVTWYLEKAADGSYFLHYKHAVLENGEWLAQAVDLDAQTGKWHSLVLDKDGNPHISYDSFVNGELKYAGVTGSNWNISVVDSRRLSGKYNVGMGNSLILDSQGLAHISYETNSEIKYAEQTTEGFKVQTVAPAAPWASWLSQRTSLALDSQGYPHIVYEDAGSLKHAFWNGKRWVTEILAAYESNQHLSRFQAAAIGRDDVIYVSYSDPADGSIKLMVGTPIRAISEKSGPPASANISEH